MADEHKKEHGKEKKPIDVLPMAAPPVDPPPPPPPPPDDGEE